MTAKLLPLVLLLALAAVGCLSPDSADPPNGLALKTGPVTSEPAPPVDQSTGVLFFWGEDCHACHDVRPFVEELARTHPDIQFDFVEIYRNETNATRYHEANSALNVTPRGIPEVIAGRSAFFGEEEIREKLPGAVQAIETGRGERGG